MSILARIFAMPKRRPPTSDNYASQIDGLSPPCTRQDPKGRKTLERFHATKTEAQKHFISTKGASARATKLKGVTLPKFSWDKAKTEEGK